MAKKTVKKSSKKKTVSRRSNVSSSKKYGGFWKRFVASIIDWVVILAVFGIFARASPYEYIAALSGIVIFWLYFAIMESSSWQATLGKKALGMRVTDLNGRRIGFGRATGRYFAKYVSAIILLIGFIMVAFTEKKQGLHDMMAGTVVMSR